MVAHSQSRLHSSNGVDNLAHDPVASLICAKSLRRADPYKSHAQATSFVDHKVGDHPNLGNSKSESFLDGRVLFGGQSFTPHYPNTLALLMTKRLM